MTRVEKSEDGKVPEGLVARKPVRPHGGWWNARVEGLSGEATELSQTMRGAKADATDQLPT